MIHPDTSSDSHLRIRLNSYGENVYLLEKHQKRYININKYKKCFAIIKGIVIKDIDRSMLTDETIDEEQLLNE